MKEFNSLLSSYGYDFEATVETGLLYIASNKPDTKPAVLLDTELFSLSPEHFHYIHYTSVQNSLMHKYNGVLRFCESNEQELKIQLEHFLKEYKEPERISLFGSNRSQIHIDPTPPEFNFALIFENVFGSQALHALKAEVTYIDRAGKRRFVDYILKKKGSEIGIELNGESYHHPLLIGKDRYRSQLFKQNSLVSDGKKVFRWSNRGMADSTKISDQLREYFGSADSFKSNPAYMAKRSISSFELYDHQINALAKIEAERAKGKTTFLIVLPTGTGKTEVFIEDMKRQLSGGKAKKVLILVPTRALKEQTINRLQERSPTLLVGANIESKSAQIIVHTNAMMLRLYSQLESNEFDYILVDEAHRAASNGLRKILEHFSPQTLIGLTATSERLDQRNLEDVFGSYEIDLTLKQAIEKGIVPPIRAFRLRSNIDLSKVRFNGKDFVKSDLNKTVQIPSRDQLIVDTLKKYFGKPLKYGKPLSQGIVFCVDIKHTKRMSKLLNENGISAASVHGTDRHGLKEYENKNIRFLCACELLNEGWDAPQTEIVVMARPTMSKVLYTQQLGRGTRRHPGKEALYVVDVVDSYGAALHPFSSHSLLQIPNYLPFGNLVNPEQGSHVQETTVLEGLFEREHRIEPINIFNFEQEFGNLINEEQLARELFVSTGTIKSWVKKKEIRPTKTIPFGRHMLNYFEPSVAENIRLKKGLKERTKATRYDDFFEFLEQRDYTFSYKIVFMLSLLKHINQQGEALLVSVSKSYQGFYQELSTKFKAAEKAKNPLNAINKLEDLAYIQRSILQNPFEKFERKRFMYQCKDLALISFDAVLWERLNRKDIARIQDQMIKDGIDYYQKINMTLLKEDFAGFTKP